jgi:hypothetical protein
MLTLAVNENMRRKERRRLKRARKGEILPILPIPTYTDGYESSATIEKISIKDKEFLQITCYGKWSLIPTDHTYRDFVAIYRVPMIKFSALAKKRELIPPVDILGDLDTRAGLISHSPEGFEFITKYRSLSISGRLNRDDLARALFEEDYLQCPILIKQVSQSVEA